MNAKTYEKLRGAEYDDISTTSLGTLKQQLLQTFEQFVDAMAMAYKPTGGEPQEDGPGTYGGGDDASGTGPGNTTSGSAGVTATVGSTAVGGISGAGQTGKGSTGTMGKGGASGGTGSFESTLTTGTLHPTGKAGSKAGRETTTAKAGYGGKGATTAKSTDGKEDSEAYAREVAGLREAYRLDIAREATRTPSRSEAAPPSVAVPALDGFLRNKHMRDSNTAPLRDVREFAPAFGKHGRPRSATNEVIAKRIEPYERPVTVPEAVQPTVKLDAYWASHHSPLERAQERARIVRKISSEAVIGTDDRVRVTNTQDYPFRCICSLLITAQNGSLYVGTAWLVAPRLLLTAGHCVYMSDEGGWASEIEVIPGRDADERPFGAVICTNLRSVTGWTVDGDRDYDYGAILLPEDRRLGDELGWFGYATRADDQFPGIDLNLAGYPADGGPDRLDGTQWQDHRAVKEVNQRQITYEIDTYGGQSGAPVWETTGSGDRYGLAIHTWGTSVSNGATRITSDVFDNITAWVGEVP